MKSNKTLEFLINPFIRIAGWQAFGVGMVFIVLMGSAGWFVPILFDGTLDMHFVNEVNGWRSFSVLAIDLLTIVPVMYGAGWLLSKSFRLIDIVGTMTLAKAPYLLLALIGLFTKAPDMSQIMTNPYAVFDSPSFIFLLALSLPVTIWSVALMYNALKVSCGAKGSQLTVVFITAVIVAEILSKVLIIKIL